MANVTTDGGKPTEKRVLIRAAIYIGATHLFAGFIMLLFAVAPHH